MYFPKLSIAVVAVSMSVAAQTPQQHGQAYLCERESEYKNLFPRPVVLELQNNACSDWNRLDESDFSPGVSA